MLSTTERTKLRRDTKRARTDREDLYAVLDAGLVCHLGVIYNGAPMVVPTGYGRIDDNLYLHGSAGARSLHIGGEVCVTVTHLDGIVLARSGFHSSVNYRSAMIYGTPHEVTDPDEKLAGLRAVTEQLAPGRWDVMRPPTAKELAATTVLALPLTEASVKVRTGPPEDDEADYALQIWAGVLPLRTDWGEPEPDPLMLPAREVPDYIAHRRRPFQPPGSLGAQSFALPSLRRSPMPVFKNGDRVEVNDRSEIDDHQRFIGKTGVVFHTGVLDFSDASSIQALFPATPPMQQRPLIYRVVLDNDEGTLLAYAHQLEASE